MEVGNSVVITCSFKELVAIYIAEKDAEIILNDVGVVKNILYEGDSIEVYFPKISDIGGNYCFEPTMLKVV